MGPGDLERSGRVSFTSFLIKATTFFLSSKEIMWAFKMSERDAL